MTCEEIQDLLPGYVLDALDAHEMEQVDAHLATCREHDEDLVDLRATGMAFALLDDAAPSAALRASLACLQDCAGEEAVFRRDLARLRQRAPGFAATGPCGRGGRTARPCADRRPRRPIRARAWGRRCRRRTS